MTFIPQNNPKAGYLAHREEIDAAVQRVLQSGWYILGQEVTEFEREFAASMGVAEAVGVASGTDAIALALRAAGVEKGDGVITVSHTAVATVAAIEITGATPILLDIDPATYTMSVKVLGEFLETRDVHEQPEIKAIVPVHLYGHPADMKAIMDLARHYKLSVIEDCAQSHGALFAGKAAGTWGDAGVFSFYPTKNLGGFGDGGAVVTNDSALAARVRLLREYGWKERYLSAVAGVNSRLDELQAAILRVKLKYLASENARRRDVASQYSKSLQGSAVTLPMVSTNVEHVYHQYVIRSPQRDQLREYLKTNSVGTLVHYPHPIHLQPPYLRYAHASGLMETEQAAREVLSLPMHPGLSDDEVSQISEVIQNWEAES